MTGLQIRRRPTVAPVAVVALGLAGTVGLLSACSAPSGGTDAGESGTVAADAPFFPPTNRPDVRGTRGAVVSDHPLASAAAHDVLRRGGNAIDAAVAAAGVLAVVRPHMNGMGGDAFALIYEAATGEVHALNGSGRAGALATPEFFAAAGDSTMPYVGPRSVSVPGAPAAWVDAVARFGTRPLSELLARAAGYARDGFPVSTRLAFDFESQGGDLSEEGRTLFLPDGAPPTVGALLRNPALAETLERIGRDGAAGFYGGPVAEAISAFLEERGGYLREPDFAAHTSSWVEPLSTDYLGHTFLVMPPNTQGLTQLQQMEMAEALDLTSLDHNSPEYLHGLIEIKKRAFADRDRWMADPEFADIPIDQLLDDAYLAERAASVDPQAAAETVPAGVGEPIALGPDRDGLGLGDTVYLTVVDADGNAVSWIQSLYAGFGSGLLEPTTGVVLQNRGALFTLDDGHPNQVAPGKRPFHTLTPMMALRDGDLAFTIGTPGGDAQTQSLLQITHNLLVYGMTPQEAVEAPRFRSYGGVSVAIEDRVPGDTRAALTERGHELRIVSGWTATFGGAQLIRVEPSGSLTAAADPRREAYAVAH
ncbi:MAG: gamma-glutamyltransferase [Gemmatimonadetes bacterium]|nr:gamma-glutamyltransferase [Gemmatimonadota bacterium]